ncbi:hypothetical protein ACIQI7_15615 [Kitasatospora sp. NPDC092039]|uniref:hypothetical protein n=1 Tax=Kitasatospora sp. NPDC092039 TaxID=3364086 RepID=UPI0038224E33
MPTEGATALNNLGLLLRELRRFEEAADAQTRAAEAVRTLSDRHREANMLSCLSTTLTALRHSDDAVDTKHSGGRRAPGERRPAQ